MACSLSMEGFGAAGLAMPGVVCITAPAYTNAQDAASQMNALDAQLSGAPLDGVAINNSDELIVVIRSHNVGDLVKVKYTRNSISREATVTLAASKK